LLVWIRYNEVAAYETEDRQEIRKQYNLNNFFFMEYSEVQKVKEAWGNKVCDHQHLEKEYYVGAFLINWVCIQCGKEFTIAEKLETDQSRKVSSVDRD
jgi:hypothetical protein